MSRFRRRLAACVSAPAEAREFVVSTCPPLPRDTMDVLRLLTTELVNNAIWHGPADDMWLDVAVESGRVEVGVTDGGAGAVKLASEYRWPESGHGLRLVDALSERWGVDPVDAPVGKRVWFEVSRQAACS